MSTITIDVEKKGGCGGVTTAIVEGIAALSGRDPTDLDICLADYVDTDALETLFAGPDATVMELWITVEQYEATVRSNGIVTVTERCGTAGDTASATVG